MVPQSVTRDVILRVFDSSLSDFAAIGAQWQVGSDLMFYVVDGTENSCPTGLCGLENTGLSLTPGVWHLVQVDIDPTARTWNFFVDGVRYNAPDPLGFRGQPTSLDGIEYLNEIAAPSGSYLDAVTVNTSLNTAVPEPSSCAILAVGVFALFACRLHRR